MRTNTIAFVAAVAGLLCVGTAATPAQDVQIIVNGQAIDVNGQPANPAASAPAEPAPPPAKPASSPEEIVKLIAQMGDNEYKIREQAYARLVSTGEPALADLEKAAATATDEEIKSRAAKAVAIIKPALLRRQRELDAQRIDWTYPLKSTLRAGPVLAGKRVVFMTAEGELVAIDAATGKPQWTQALKSTSGFLAMGENVLLLATADNTVQCLSGADGKPLWLAKLPVELACRITAQVYPDAIYVTPWMPAGFKVPKGTIVALSPKDGGTLASYELAACPTCPPVRADKLLLVHTPDGNLQALQVEGGKQAWTVNVGPIISTPLASAGVGYVVTADTKPTVLAVDLKDGKSLWKAELDITRLVRMPYPLCDRLAAGDGLIVASVSDHVVALDAAKGTVLWDVSLNEPSGGAAPAGGPAAGMAVARAMPIARRVIDTPAPVVRDGVVYVGHALGLVALEAKTGKQLWAIDLPGTTQPPLLAQDRLIVAADRAAGAAGGAMAMAGNVNVAVGGNGQVIVQRVVVQGGGQVIINGQPVQPAGQPAGAREPGIYGIRIGPLPTTQPAK